MGLKADAVDRERDELHAGTDKSHTRGPSYTEQPRARVARERCEGMDVCEGESVVRMFLKLVE